LVSWAPMEHFLQPHCRRVMCLCSREVFCTSSSTCAMGLQLQLQHWTARTQVRRYRQWRYLIPASVRWSWKKHSDWVKRPSKRSSTQSKLLIRNLESKVIYIHTYFMSIDVASDATFKLFFRIVFGTAANFVQGIRFSIPLDMKVVELTVMPFNSQ